MKDSGYVLFLLIWDVSCVRSGLFACGHPHPDRVLLGYQKTFLSTERPKPPAGGLMVMVRRSVGHPSSSCSPLLTQPAAIYRCECDHGRNSTPTSPFSLNMFQLLLLPSTTDHILISSYNLSHPHLLDKAQIEVG